RPAEQDEGERGGARGEQKRHLQTSNGRTPFRRRCARLGKRGGGRQRHHWRRQWLWSTPLLLGPAQGVGQGELGRVTLFWLAREGVREHARQRRRGGRGQGAKGAVDHLV